MLTNDVVSFEQPGPGVLQEKEYKLKTMVTFTVRPTSDRKLISGSCLLSTSLLKNLRDILYSSVIVSSRRFQ